MRRIETAGSLRRRRATIGDIDLLAAVDDPAELFARLGRVTGVDRVLGSGVDKSSIVLAEGPQIDLMVCPPSAWGTHLVHLTGSAAHNVALRGRALDRGLSLSEKGFKEIETGQRFAIFAGMMALAAVLFGLRAVFYFPRDYTQG